MTGSDLCDTHPSSFLPSLSSATLSDLETLQRALCQLEIYIKAHQAQSLAKIAARRAGKDVANEKGRGGFEKLEKAYAERWLTRVIGVSAEDALIDKAGVLLNLLSNPTNNAGPQSYLFGAPQAGAVEVVIQDSHMRDDVHATGFRTWDSAIYLSQIAFDDPVMFCGVKTERLSEHTPTKVKLLELGSGTGLAGISVLKALQAPSLGSVLVPVRLILTDYDETTLQTLRQNVVHNLPSTASTPFLEIRNLSWEYPKTLDISDFDVIFAADVIYEPQHPRLIYDTVYTLLARNEKSLFHLVVSLRSTHESDIAELEQLFGDKADPVASDAPALLIVNKHDSNSQDFQYPLRYYCIKWRQVAPESAIVTAA